MGAGLVRISPSEIRGEKVVSSVRRPQKGPGEFDATADAIEKMFHVWRSYIDRMGRIRDSAFLARTKPLRFRVAAVGFFSTSSPSC
jgi:hypothetical protein